MNKYLKMKKLLKSFSNIKVRVRKCSYKGKGRPKKSDFILLKVKEIPDFKVTELLFNAINISYMNK